MEILARLPAPAGPVLLPETVATYMNLGPIRQRGAEVSLEHRFRHGVAAFANYSWQAVPKILAPKGSQERYPLAEVAPGPRHRLNLGARYDGPRVFADLDLNYVSRTFWDDVLNASYHGFTEAYEMLNGTLGVKLAGGKLALSLRGTNLLDRKIQQHVYGDITRRALVLQARFSAK
jgi:outer membrane receptor protein involved in Fe transport